MPQKRTDLEKLEIIKKYPYKLVGRMPVNNVDRTEFLCEKHGVFTKNIKALILGYGCIKCSAKSRAQKRVHTADSFRFLVNKKFKNKIKSTFLDSEWNPNSELSFSCTDHGAFKRKPVQIYNSRHGCLKCGKVFQGKLLKSIEDLSRHLEGTQFKIITKERKDCYQKIQIECQLHGLFTTTVNRIKNKSLCRKCSHIKGAKTRSTPRDVAEKIVRSFGYELGEDYTNVAKKCTILCSKHGKFKLTVADIQDGHGCRACSVGKSQPNDDLFNLTQNLGFQAIKNDRSTLRNNRTNRPIELDIYVPSKKFAIEYCGLYWHSEELRGRNHLKEKLLIAKSLGVDLLTIFEDEWISKPDIVKNIIKSKLGVLPRVFARKTELREISSQEAYAFFNKHHLQGAPKSISVAFGLFHQEALIGCVSAGNHHRNKNSSNIVLNRLCFAELSVVGGASKLFNALKSWAKNQGYESIVSWSDNRWSTGKVYEKLGMSGKELPIDYSYLKKNIRNKRFSKQSKTKKNLIKLGASGLSESEMAKSLGLYRIYDCGKVRWTYDLKSNL